MSCSRAQAVLDAYGAVIGAYADAGRETVLAAVLGRSGTLRAPTLRLGKRFLVGWSEALYREYLATEQQQ